MTGFASESIGKSTAPFTGIFNGGKFTITITNTNVANYLGFFGYCSGSVSNCTIVYGDNFTINPIQVNAGGFVANLSGTGSIANCNVMFGDNATITASPTAEQLQIAAVSVGGFIGFLNFTNSSGVNFSNCNIAFGNNANITYINPPGSTGGCFSGGFIGQLEEQNNNLSVSLNFYNCNVVFKDFTNITSSNASGGFIGSAMTGEGLSKGVVKNCTALFGNNTTVDSVYVGGFVGETNNTFLNCSCIYGNNTTFKTVEIIGGFAGAVLYGTAINCNAIFGSSYQFLLNGVNGSETDEVSAFVQPYQYFVATNCNTLAYGTALIDFLPGPGTAPGYDIQTAVLNSYNLESYIQWFGYKIRFDHNITGDGSITTNPEIISSLDTQYLKEMLTLSPEVPNFIKINAIKTSNISTTYKDIKNILSIQSDILADNAPITYLEQASSYTLDKNKNYYLPVSTTTLTIDGSNFNVSSNKFTGTITITFKGKKNAIRTNNSLVINGIKFSNHGTGSIVLGVEEPNSKGLEFWWWILIVLGVLLLVVLVYYFVKYYKNSKMNSVYNSI